MSNLVLSGLFVLGGLGFLMGMILVLAATRFRVRVDERLKEILNLLPNANCGGCGFPGCAAFAERLLEEGVSLSLCSVLGEENRVKIAEILGREEVVPEKKIAVLVCQGGKKECARKFFLRGKRDCRSVALLHSGDKRCDFACLGYGHCVTVCPFGAIRMGENELPIIDEEKCTGCGICVRECPKQVLRLIPKTKLVYLACVSTNKGREVREVCRVGCFACGICIKVCPYNALHLENNLPVMDFSLCTDCGICVHKCPTKSYVDRAKARPYAMISTACDGCGECVKVCQFQAIEGKIGERHKVIIEKCIGCGECFKVCPIKAITMVGALGYAYK
ncbi:MAG: 4Fe-4S binding protein [candidate division WOR-3 bacterium]